MKLRLRSLESKQTIKIELPNPSSTLQQLKQTLSQSLSSSSSSSLHFSLNRKDELHASSPEATLQSLGITSGDLIFFTHNPTAFSSQSQSQSQTLIPNSSSSVQQQPPNPNSPNQNMSEKAEITPSDQETPEHEISDPETDVDMSDSTTANLLQEDDEETLGGEISGSGSGPSGAETMELDDGSSVLSGKKCFEHYFLRRVLREELGGGDGSDHKLMVIAIHAVLLESGFVGFDSVSGMRVDGFHLRDVWPSKAFSMSLCYTLPELLGIVNVNGNGYNVPESIVLKFQNVGHCINIYGSLAKGGSGLHRVCLNENRFVPALESVWVVNGESNEEIENQDGFLETEVFEFWKIVKDGIALPLLIDLCEKAGLEPPPCFMRLPTELKLKIFESLPGVDLAKVGCVCSDLRYLSSANELWKQKFEEEFENGRVAKRVFNWKEAFQSFWDRKKKRKRELRQWCQGFSHVPVMRNRMLPAVLLRGQHDHMPCFSVPSPFRQVERFRVPWNVPHCTFEGSDD
ncbi:F-box protein SKIP22-like [Castanea sativa]|uniref:F-box protein SKIP22-like n=1 Tax=Castanea sativa TaxID=21020 RepID=UPI003F65135F